MKEFIFTLITLILVVSVAIGQPANSDSTADTLVAMEKAAWEAWINHDVHFFENYLAEDALLVHPNGRFPRNQQLEDVAAHPCEVKDYTLDNFDVIRLAEDARLLTYEAWSDVTCAGEVQPPKTLSTVVFVKRQGTWVNVFYQETPVVE